MILALTEHLPCVRRNSSGDVQMNFSTGNENLNGEFTVHRNWWPKLCAAHMPEQQGHHGVGTRGSMVDPGEESRDIEVQALGQTQGRIVTR